MISYLNFIELLEGNPLGRIIKNTKDGRHFSILSAQRGGLSPEENAQRHKALKKEINSLGYSHKEVEGHWQGDKEKSILVHAKGIGDHEGESLRNDMNSLGEKYGQDGVFHYHPKEEQGHVYGTNSTGWPGYGNKENVGKLTFNKKSDFQTETKPKANTPLKPGRTEKSPSRFSTE